MKRHAYEKRDMLRAFRLGVEAILTEKATWKYRNPNMRLRRFIRSYPCSACGLWKRARWHR